MIPWQTFAAYAAVADDTCPNLALFQKNFRKKKKYISQTHSNIGRLSWNLLSERGYLLKYQNELLQPLFYYSQLLVSHCLVTDTYSGFKTIMIQFPTRAVCEKYILPFNATSCLILWQ